MPLTKGRIERAGRVFFNDASLHVWEEGLLDARKSGGWGSEKQWESKFKRDVFTRIIQCLHRLGWTVGPWVDAAHYKAIALSHRSCRKGDLQGELDMCGRHIEFKVWQDVQNVDNPNGGKYDFDKEARMTYLQRLEMDRTRRRIRDYLCNVFTGYEFEDSRRPVIGLLGITAEEYAARDRKNSGHYRPALDRAEIGMPSNATARDGGTIEHGAKVWALDYSGRIVTGTAYYALNSNWQIVTGKYGLLSTHTGRIFTAQPENLRLKRNSRERRKRLESELTKAVKGMDFVRANTLKSLLFPGDPALFNVWNKDHKLFHSPDFCGYTSDVQKAGKFTAEEVRSWDREPNLIVPFDAAQMAA